jgi:cupin fold WbuC family metalloprotein
MLVLQRGCIDVLTFNETGEVLNRSTLDRTASIMQIPMSEWHTCIVCEPGTVIIEIKPGPYRPNEFADWAPEEGHERAAAFMHWATSAKLVQKWQPS